MPKVYMTRVVMGSHLRTLTIEGHSGQTREAKITQVKHLTCGAQFNY
jgi:hypothetical protein